MPVLHGPPAIARIVAFVSSALLGDARMSSCDAAVRRDARRSRGAHRLLSSVHPRAPDPRFASAIHLLGVPSLPRARPRAARRPLRWKCSTERGLPVPGRPSIGAYSAERHHHPRPRPTNASASPAAVWAPGPSADTQVVSVGVRGVGSVELRTLVDRGRPSPCGRPTSVSGPGRSRSARRPQRRGRAPSSPAARFRWESADSTTARVGAEGVADRSARGTTRIIATVGAATGASSVVVVPAVAGRLFSLDGATPPASRVVVRSGLRVDRSTSADGMFLAASAHLSRRLGGRDDRPGRHRHWGARLRVRSARELGDCGSSSCPPAWTVSSGRHSGP